MLPNADNRDVPLILAVCTANQCRSVMAEALLRRELDRCRLPIDVGSAGFLAGGVSPPEQIVAVMASIGVDVSGHLSRTIEAELVDQADLILTMERQHAIELASDFPAALPRTFTAAEFVRRASTFQPVGDLAGLRAWAGELSADRTRAELMAERLSDDVVDPMGGSRRDFIKARDWQLAWTAKVVDLLAGPA